MSQVVVTAMHIWSSVPWPVRLWRRTVLVVVLRGISWRRALRDWGLIGAVVDWGVGCGAKVSEALKYV